MTAVILIDTFLLILVTITAVAIIEVRNLYASAMLTSVYSLLMALVWVNMHSMDVAFTEAAVGGGISPILLMATLVHTAREEKPQKSRVHWKAAAVTALCGAALIYATPWIVRGLSQFNNYSLAPVLVVVLVLIGVGGDRR